MPRTKNGWIPGLQPLAFSVRYHVNHVLFSLTTNEGERVALELRRPQAQFVALIGRQEEEKIPALDAEFEVKGKLFVSDSPVETSCVPVVEQWEGAPVHLRMQFEQQPQRCLWSVRDPENQRGFVLKLTESARGTLFAAICAGKPPELQADSIIEGDLEIVQ